MSQRIEHFFQLSSIAPQIVAVGVDNEGMRPDILQSALEKAISSGSSGIPKVRWLLSYLCRFINTLHIDVIWQI